MADQSFDRMIGYLHGRAANACPTKGCGGVGSVWSAKQKKMIPCLWCQELSEAIDKIISSRGETHEESKRNEEVHQAQPQGQPQNHAEPADGEVGVRTPPTRR